MGPLSQDPMVVFADADLEKAAADAVAYSLMNCGQVCCSVERVYVAREVKAAFEARCADLARQWVAGPGSVEGVRLGPMVSTMQRALVEQHGWAEAFVPYQE